MRSMHLINKRASAAACGCSPAARPARRASPVLSRAQPGEVAIQADAPTNVQTDNILNYQQQTQARRAEMAAQRAAERLSEEIAQQTGLPWWEVDCPSNMVNVHSVAELQAAVEGANAAGHLAVVQFFATDCYACKSMQPKMRQIARDNADAVFCKVNGAASEELRQYCEDMGIDRIPYFHFYKDGRRVDHFSANMRPEKLQQLRLTIAAHRRLPAPEELAVVVADA